jgi:hypothetical protein
MATEDDRHDLVAHLREQIAADPEAYANDAKLEAVVNSHKLAEDLLAPRTLGEVIVWLRRQQVVAARESRAAGDSPHYGESEWYRGREKAFAECLCALLRVIKEGGEGG